jgi:hypothetical protein
LRTHPAQASPAITALVTHKHGDKEPGPGWYLMEQSLGYGVAVPYAFWATQVQDVFKRYGKPSNA